MLDLEPKLRDSQTKRGIVGRYGNHCTKIVHKLRSHSVTIELSP